MVGSPGAIGEGCKVLTASALNRPDLMCVVTAAVVPNITCNCPLSKGMTAPPLLL